VARGLNFRIQQEIDMLVRAAIVMASIFMAGQTLAADTLNSACGDSAMRLQPASTAQVVIAPPGFGQLADGVDMGESTLHAQELKRIAVYAAIGNRDGVEIASQQLRQFGVTHEEVQDAIDRTHLHGDTITRSMVRQSRIESENNPAMKVSY
jgi:hypothetical protein